MAVQGEHAISWTDITWNPIRGCSRVSEGCRFCYAERQAVRFSGESRTTKAGKRTGPQPYHGLVQMKNGHPQWTGKIAFAEHHLHDPFHWKQPKRVFANSMSDLFHEGVEERWLHEIFAVMALNPQHTFQVLSKRPERMREYLSAAAVT